jgi:type II secretory pathway pseudopilin PulG
MSKFNEQGRSMVEMLGVLAIIGVLSVGGIYGYSVAMRSYRVNEIAHAVSMLYSVGRGQDGGAGTSELTYTPTFPSLPKGADVITYVDHTITVKTTDPEDCPILVNKIGTSGPVFAVPCSNGTTVVIYQDSSNNAEAGNNGGGEEGGGEEGEIAAGEDCPVPNQRKCSNYKYHYCNPATNKWLLTGETC